MDITVFFKTINARTSKKNFVFPVGTFCGEAWERFQWSSCGRFLATTKRDHLCIFDAHDNFKPIKECV